MKSGELDHAEMQKLTTLNLTAAQIAERVGCSRRTVERWRKTNGLVRQSHANTGVPLTADRLEAIEAMLDDGASYNDIQQTLHVSSHSLRKYFPGRGWTTAQSGHIAALSKRLNRLTPHIR